MKEAILLEQFILNTKATNAEHREALALLQALVLKYEQKVEECNNCKTDK